MKPATVKEALSGLEALFEAAQLAAPSPLAVAAVLRAIASEAQRLQSKMEHSRQANKVRQAELVLIPTSSREQKKPVEATNTDLADLLLAQRIRSTSARVMEIGHRLLLLREESPHGTFRAKIKALGVALSEAYRCMAAARRFSAAPTLVEAARTPFALNTLLYLDDNEILELNRGGTVRGLTLEDVRGMTVEELRKALQ
jgi:hypothetical protein